MDHSGDHDLPAVPAPHAGVDPGDRQALRLTVDHRRGTEVLSVSGDIDLSALAALSAVLAEAIARRPALLVVDLTPASFLGCAGLSLLLAADRLAGASTRVIVVASSRSIRRPLQVTRADRLLTVRGCLADALVEADPAPKPVRVSTLVIDGVSLIVAPPATPGI